MPNPFVDDQQSPKVINLPALDPNAALNTLGLGQRPQASISPFQGGYSTMLSGASRPAYQDGVGYMFDQLAPQKPPIGGQGFYSISEPPVIGFGVGGGVGSPFATQRRGLGVGGGIGSPFSGGGGNLNPNETPTRRYARMKFDKMFGDGWTDTFIAQNGVDPITFHLRDFPQLAGDPEAQAQAAERAAENDARFQPDAIAEWRKVHGGQEIPQSQWEKWYYMAQNGGANYSQGDGINPFNVY